MAWDIRLIDACEGSNLYHVKEALENGANIHAFGDLAFVNACENSRLNIVQLLIQYGAYFEIIEPLEQWFNNHGSKFMFEAFESMTPEVSQQLMEKHGECVFDQYMNENIDVPDNLAQSLMENHAFHVMEQYLLADKDMPTNLSKHIPNIEHQEQEIHF